VGKVHAALCARMQRLPNHYMLLGEARDHRYVDEIRKTGALVEAVSLGCTPLVFTNPCELAIVCEGETGLVASSLDHAVELLSWMLTTRTKCAGSAPLPAPKRVS